MRMKPIRTARCETGKVPTYLAESKYKIIGHRDSQSYLAIRRVAATGSSRVVTVVELNELSIDAFRMML